MRNHILLSTITTLFLFNATIVYSAIKITGIVTAKYDDSLMVEIPPNAKAVPSAGDKVDFFLQIDDIDINAGHGEVMEVQTNTVRVKTTDDRPALKMKAVIHTTGSGEKVKPGSANITNRDLKRYVEKANAECDRAKSGTGYIATNFKDNGSFDCMPNQATANMLCDELNSGSWVPIRINRDGSVHCNPSQIQANAACDRVNDGTGHIATNFRDDGFFDCMHFQDMANSECDKINTGNGYLATNFRDDGTHDCMPSQAVANMRCDEANSGSGLTAINIRADGNFDCTR